MARCDVNQYDNGTCFYLFSRHFYSKYENVGQNQCPYRNSVSYLIQCGHAPLNKTVIKKTIFRSYSAADGQMSGEMMI